MSTSDNQELPFWAHHWIRVAVGILMSAGLGWQILNDLGAQAQVYSMNLIGFGAAYGVILFSFLIYTRWDEK